MTTDENFTPVADWVHPESGATATVHQYPPALHPDTWCVSFRTPEGRPNGGANLESRWVARTLENKGFIPADSPVAETAADARTVAHRAFPTAAEGVDRPSLTMPRPAVRPDAPTPAKSLGKKR